MSGRSVCIAASLSAHRLARATGGSKGNCRKSKMIIGITGGVGSGKSTILNILHDNYGAHIIQADDVAKELMEPGMECYRLIVEAFGSDILVPEETDPKRPIDRPALAKIAFSSEEKRQLLNSLTHPQVKRDIIRRIREIYTLESEALIVVEAALLIEAEYTDILDQLWVVFADKETRIARLAASRGYTREKTESVMASQLSDEQFKAAADIVIDNSGTPKESEHQIADALLKCGYLS